MQRLGRHCAICWILKKRKSTARSHWDVQKLH
uniref:Uncharacterized protein n=1 Tax=Anguilla anguilla TaxID=7936 RepID=A0A0E9S9J2_ANGAN